MVGETNSNSPTITQVSGAGSAKKTIRPGDVLSDIKRPGGNNNDADFTETGRQSIFANYLGTRNRTSETLQSSSLIGRAFNGTPNGLVDSTTIPALGFGAVADGSGVLDQLALSGLNLAAPGSNPFPPFVPNFGGLGALPGSGSSSGTGKTGGSSKDSSSSSGRGTSSTNGSNAGTAEVQSDEEKKTAAEKAAKAQLIDRRATVIANEYPPETDQQLDYLKAKLPASDGKTIEEQSYTELQKILSDEKKSNNEKIDAIIKFIKDNNIELDPETLLTNISSSAVQNSLARLDVGFGTAEA